MSTLGRSCTIAFRCGRAAAHPARGHARPAGTTDASTQLLGPAAAARVLATNARGQIVGYAFGPREHAFVYDPALDPPLQDLNALVGPASAMVLERATAIDGAGRIAGTGAVDGAPHAFLLTPLRP